MGGSSRVGKGDSRGPTCINGIDVLENFRPWHVFGLDPKKAMIERSVPKKVFKDAMLAWEMNGVPVPNAHGGPLRMVTPGYFGINNVNI